MEIYEMIDLQDCPRCFGPSILEEEDHSYYVMYFKLQMKVYLV